MPSPRLQNKSGPDAGNDRFASGPKWVLGCGVNAITCLIGGNWLILEFLAV